MHARKSRLVALVTVAVLSASDAAPARDASPTAAPGLAQLSPADLRMLWLGHWSDDRKRWWFTIDEIVGNDIRRARFRLAHLKQGHIEGDRLTLVSESCVVLIGCYSYTHIGRLIGQARMDMYGTDDDQTVVHFPLNREP
jgi:hypothetical protein